MKAVIQRVSHARVSVNGREEAAIGRGLAVLLGVAAGDGMKEARWMAGKIARLRIFPDEKQLMNLSVQDICGEILLVSQFTLLGDARKGNRPGFATAASPEEAERLYQEVAGRLSGEGITVRTGIFGAMMEVELVNDGPVTIILDTER